MRIEDIDVNEVRLAYASIFDHVQIWDIKGNLLYSYPYVDRGEEFAGYCAKHQEPPESQRFHAALDGVKYIFMMGEDTEEEWDEDEVTDAFIRAMWLEIPTLTKIYPLHKVMTPAEKQRIRAHIDPKNQYECPIFPKEATRYKILNTATKRFLKKLDTYTL